MVELINIPPIAWSVVAHFPVAVFFGRNFKHFSKASRFLDVAQVKQTINKWYAEFNLVKTGHHLSFTFNQFAVAHQPRHPTHNRLSTGHTRQAGAVPVGRGLLDDSVIPQLKFATLRPTAAAAASHYTSPVSRVTN